MTQSTQSNIIEQIKGWDTKELEEAVSTLRWELRGRSDTDYLYDSWHTEDIQEYRPDLSVEQCRQVLRELDRHHDSTVGINWDVIQITADLIYPEPVKQNTDR